MKRSEILNEIAAVLLAEHFYHVALQEAVNAYKSISYSIAQIELDDEASAKDIYENERLNFYESGLTVPKNFQSTRDLGDEQESRK
jgi:hypothetical protein